MADVRKTIWDPKEVYPPSDDSFALVDAFQQRLKNGVRYPMVLEVGSGSGFVTAEVALTGSFILATDINPVASESTKRTVAAHGMRQRAETIITRFWDGIRIDLFDLILFNPPYVPTPKSEMTGNGLSVAWAGGVDGREVIDQFLTRVYDVLSRRKLEILLVTIEQNRPPEILEDAKSRGLIAEVVLKRKADEEFIENTNTSHLTDSVRVRQMATMDDEALLSYLKNLPNNDGESLTFTLRETLQRVFTKEVVSRLEEARLLEESLLFGSLGPPNVVRAVLENIIPSLTSNSEAEVEHRL